jgi:hypothetical protein
MPRHRLAIAVAAPIPAAPILAAPILAAPILAALILATPTAEAQNAPPAAYQPGLGDLMTMTVQPRHLKVGLAGQEKNWVYLQYELQELDHAFARIVKLVPKWRDHDIANLIASSVKQPIEELEEAAKVQAPPLFYDAYVKLTAACNACHASVNMGMIVIQMPRGSPFSNQDFRPQKP